MRLQTRLEICVRYACEARDCRRVLRVLPLHRSGQTVMREGWKVAPDDADLTLEKRDAQGNRRLLMYHRRIAREWRFELEVEAQTTGDAVLEFAPDAPRWKMPSRAVGFRPELQLLARGSKELAPLQRAAHFARFCERNLEYEAATDAAPLDAAQVWARRRGNCADFAHLFLALCRASGLLARYVAGFSRGEGQMHAWAEVWFENNWHAFDPTIEGGRPIHHIAVAVGRDFYDCAPHSGQFRGAGSAQIKVWCRTRAMDAG